VVSKDSECVHLRSVAESDTPLQVHLRGTVDALRWYIRPWSAFTSGLPLSDIRGMLVVSAGVKGVGEAKRVQDDSASLHFTLR
jgi:hypothetical protein